MNGRGKAFWEQLDTMFLISEEMVKGHGEDSYYCKYDGDSGVVSVFDGCGGLGSRTYEGLGGHTGAYIASRLASGAVHDWYHSGAWRGAVDIPAGLDSYIKKAYSIGTPYAQGSLKLRGTMVRDLPTTAALVLAQSQADKVLLHIIWAGDSRVYLMDSHGLAQLTKDDIQNDDDAMSNLMNDGALTNVLSSDGNYQLHYRRMSISKPTAVFAATDGCFGYIPSPMEFEYTLLDSMVKADSPKGFQTTLKKRIGENTGDDFAFGFMSFFYGTFEAMKSFFYPRAQKLWDCYISPLQEGRQDVRRLWEMYRQDYERYWNP